MKEILQEIKYELNEVKDFLIDYWYARSKKEKIVITSVLSIVVLGILTNILT